MFRWILVGLALIHIFDSSSGETSQRATTVFCTRIASFTEDHIVTQSKKQKVYFTDWCLSIKLRCTEYKYETVYFNTTIKVNKTRIVRDCCTGFKKVNGTCEPICRVTCGHGECVAPDKCLCEPGWKDPLCLTSCEENTYGRGCKDNCTCFNGARCDKRTGFCYCRKGYTGEFCEHPCPENTYGVNCKQTCLCENDAICNKENGSCQCQEGYLGKYCENKCEDGTHGQNCKHECICISENTESCHHIDGKCLCKVGYKGNYCEKQCENFTYGRGCNKICHCMHAEFCDPFDGKCICKPGWTGLKCKDGCPDGYFGNDCKFKCDICINTSRKCDHETGYCYCPAGTFGDLCEKKCDNGYWGKNCSNVCECGKSRLCNPITGVCLCIKGHDGGLCAEDCTSRLYGEICAAECDCTCNVSTGVCDENSSNQMSSLSSNSETVMYAINALLAITLVCLVSLITVCIIKRERLVKYFKSRNDGTSTESLQNSHFANPLYGEQDISIESIRRDDVVVLDLKPSTTIVHYFRNKLDTDEMDTEKKPGAKSLNVNNIDSGSKRASSLLDDISASFKPINTTKRNSKYKLDSSYSSTDNLEKDFTPEVLGEFNIAENV